MSAVIIKAALTRLGQTQTPELVGVITPSDFLAYLGLLNFYAQVSPTTAALSIENLDVLPDVVMAVLQNPAVTSIDVDLVNTVNSGAVDVMQSFVAPGDTVAYSAIIDSIEAGTYELVDAPAPSPTDEVLQQQEPVVDTPAASGPVPEAQPIVEPEAQPEAPVETPQEPVVDTPTPEAVDTPNPEAAPVAAPIPEVISAPEVAAVDTPAPTDTPLTAPDVVETAPADTTPAVTPIQPAA